MKRNLFVSFLKDKLTIIWSEKTNYQRIGFIIISLLLIPLLAVLIQSFKWYFVVDSPIFQYIAFLILHGSVPYKDIFDMNLPGTYWLHIFAIKFIGPGDIDFRIFDLICLCIVCLSGYLLLKKQSKFSAYLFILLFTCIHLAGGEYSMGQRDFLMLPFIGMGAFFFYKSFFSRSWFYAFLAGIFLGYAIMIKPTAILFSFLLLLSFLFLNYKEKKKCVSVAFSLIAGNIIFPTIMIIWLAYLGGLKDFLNIAFNYLPIFGKNADNSFFTLFASILETPLLIIGVFIILSLAFGTVIYSRITADKPKKILYIILIDGVIFGLGHYFYQRMYFPYHMYPLYFFSAMLLALILGDLITSIDLTAKKFSVLSSLLLMIFISLLTFKTFFHKPNYLNRYENGVQNRKQLIINLEADLHQLGIKKGDTTQVFDVSQGGCSIMYRLQLNQPTRFVSEVHFTSYTWTGPYPPYLQKLWVEFIDGLHEHKPRFIIVFSSSYFFKNGQCDSQEYAPLCNFIQTYYQPKVIKDDYTIYTRIH